MSHEKVMHERLVCDGCGVSVLEAQDVLCVAPEYDWWAKGERHLCPMCRPDALVDRLDAAEAKVQAVRELHASHVCAEQTEPWFQCSIVFGGACAREGKCQVCQTPWPCDTLRVLDR